MCWRTKGVSVVQRHRRFQPGDTSYRGRFLLAEQSSGLGAEPSDQQKGEAGEDKDGQRPGADREPYEGLERNARNRVQIYTAWKTDPERIRGKVQRKLSKGPTRQIHIRGPGTGKGTDTDLGGRLQPSQTARRTGRDTAGGIRSKEACRCRWALS